MQRAYFYVVVVLLATHCAGASLGLAQHVSGYKVSVWLHLLLLAQGQILRIIILITKDYTQIIASKTKIQPIQRLAPAASCARSKLLSYPAGGL